jgi:hypothetical protein
MEGILPESGNAVSCGASVGSERARQKSKMLLVPAAPPSVGTRLALYVGNLPASL